MSKSGKLDPGVTKCIGALKGAKNDTERMAALFLVTKVVKSAELNSENLLALFDAIGFQFILRLLNTPSSSDCPSLLYKSVALSVLSTFCAQPAIGGSEQMVEVIPILITLVASEGNDGSSDEDNDQQLVVTTEAYRCLQAVALSAPGAEALVKAKAISSLVSIYTKNDADEVLEILKNGSRSIGTALWKLNPDDFNTLLDRVSLLFEVEQTEMKFELCEIMSALMSSFNKTTNTLQGCFWPSSIHKGLVDILSSKITEKQRNPALKLASFMLTTLGVDWLIRSSEEPKKAYQFLVLLINLCCIEVRMTLEDRTVDKILAQEDLIGSCYGIIETTIVFMAGNHFEFLEEKQKEQVYTALKGSSNAIIGFLNLLQTEATKKKAAFWDVRKKLLACASLRCLAAWLAEETATLKEEMFKLLPFVLTLTRDDFDDVELGIGAEALALVEVGKSKDALLPDLLCLLLPALCHLTSAEEGSLILLANQWDEVLLRFLNHNWSVYKYLKKVVESQSRFKKGKKTGDASSQLSMEEVTQIPMKLRAALAHTSNLFINLTVHNPQVVSTPVFQNVMRWAMIALPTLTDQETELVLASNIAGLGLLFLYHTTNMKTGSLSPEEEFQRSFLVAGGDNGVFRFGQSVIRFVWDAHMPDESQVPSTLILTTAYRCVWMEIKEMWFLSLQTLGCLMSTLPWLGDFAAESGFLDAIIGNLSKAYKNSIDSQTLTAYEEFLAAAVSGGDKASKILTTKGTALASSHHLRILKKALDGRK